MGASREIIKSSTKSVAFDETAKYDGAPQEATLDVLLQKDL